MMPCQCQPCRTFDAALDRHTDAIAQGRGNETRAALRLAAARVDEAHGLGQEVAP